MRSGRFTSVVLCYHAVSTTWNHLLSVRPEALERQLQLMLALRYRPAPAEAVADGARRLLHVTFDDAFRSVWNAVPVLERLRVPATVFACSDLAERGTALSAPELAAEAHAHPDELATLDWKGLAELAELHAVEIGSHTKTHARLTMLSDAELRAELLESRRRFEDELGRPCRFLAYPYGAHDERVRAAARQSGYQAAFALPGRTDRVDDFAIPRVGIWRHTGTFRTAVKTSSINRPVGALRGWQ
jgi:peptidoglycan/xylan/chitin deacetylase (PgdA/CDA1 family)